VRDLAVIAKDEAAQRVKSPLREVVKIEPLAPSCGKDMPD
jgi:hypothetical protein